MATSVLTATDLLQCSHGGPITVIVAPRRSLSAGGSLVMVQSDLTSAVIACPNVNAPCVSITSVISGASQVLTVDGSPVLLADVQGATNAGTWKATSPGSPLLKA
ncbi:hypothetical protein GCM10011575_34820 [Microlunatus endophyticus]|uniref:Uncharacterized protein n=1 Tax=Microlunatus endophyticus TaxID=1716077 RepID=A0A917W7P2_9ACTN|nr:hypothetical protein [Microlunatus endophyticus]GGL73514.1 hypothetical protein GCM10011575_34820 [Microlunatus endophyticus]